MKKIIITVPKEKGGLFKLTFGGGAKPRKNPVLIYNWAKKKVSLASQHKIKTSVVIKDGGLVTNESLPSKNKNYLMWLLTAFLEEYLPKDFFLSKEKLYVGSEA